MHSERESLSVPTKKVKKYTVPTFIYAADELGYLHHHKNYMTTYLSASSSSVDDSADSIRLLPGKHKTNVWYIFV